MESINLTLVVGLSVDYVVHLAEGYSRSTHTNRLGRLHDSLAEVGISVLSGACTTLGGSAFLLLAHYHPLHAVRRVHVRHDSILSCLRARVIHDRTRHCRSRERPWINQTNQKVALEACHMQVLQKMIELTSAFWQQYMMSRLQNMWWHVYLGQGAAQAVKQSLICKGILCNYYRSRLIYLFISLICMWTCR